MDMDTDMDTDIHGNRHTWTQTYMDTDTDTDMDMRHTWSKMGRGLVRLVSLLYKEYVLEEINKII
jgi:hypothetical protein